MNVLLLPVIGVLVLSTAFAGIFVLARRIDNYGTVTIAWSYAFAALAVFYAVFSDGWPVRRALVGTMACLWSLRLGSHLLRRVAAHHPREDGRFRQLRSDWGERFGPRMFGFFQLQALSVVYLSLPFLVASRNADRHLHPVEMTGLLVWLLALTGEGLVDTQLDAFQRNPANEGRVCASGLWRFTRHPNYFFESLVWIGFFVFALASDWGWLAILSPATVIYFLLRVTGIPPNEAQNLRSKGQAYRQYQATTSAFVPRRPRRPKG